MMQFNGFNYSSIFLVFLFVFSFVSSAYAQDAPETETCTTANVCTTGYELLSGSENSPCDTWEDGCTLAKCCTGSSTDSLFGDLNCDSSVNVTDVQLSIIVALGMPLSTVLDADQDGTPDACLAEIPCDITTDNQTVYDEAFVAGAASVDITSDNAAAIADAVAGLYTQTELDAAIEAATADLYTQAELDAALSAAVAAVDITTDNQSSYDDGYTAGAASALTCQNGGSPVCSCLAGYSGDSCETDVDDCAGDPCQNGGTCIDGVNAYTCTCATGFEGTNCEEALPVCGDVLCYNGGFCASEDGEGACVCAPGFGGATCEDTIDCATITVPETVPELMPGTGLCSATGDSCSVSDDCSETGFSVVSGDCYKSNQYTSDMCLYPVRIDTGGTPLSCTCNDSGPESGEMQSCNGTKYLEDSHYACPNGGWDWDGNEYYESLCNGAGGDW